MNLNDMTAAELRKLAAQHKIAGRSTMKKAELVAALSAPKIADLVELSTTVAQMDETPAPAPVSDHNPTDGQVAAVDLSVLSVLTDTKPQRVYTTPAEPIRKDRTVTFERTEPGRALAEMYTNESGITRSVPVVKNGKVWELVDHRNGVAFVVKARSFGKLAKRWAKKVGVWAAEVRVENYI